MSVESARIVAIETSGRHGSVAVARGAALLAVRELPATMRHAVELMPAIRDLTRETGWQPSEIEQIYLSLGPGSFTGLRIAVAIARGMAQAIGCRLVGVPSLNVIAANAPPEMVVVVPMLDAKRGQVFAARYERGEAGLVQTAPAALVDPRMFVEEALRLAAARGAEGGVKVALLGEGVDYHRPALAGIVAPAETELVEMEKELWIARAAEVHRLGFAAASEGKFCDPAGLLPLYIRLPEAEEVYRRKHGLAV